ncbi:MAG: H-NS histone family protein [Cardiobacteriaceae bacterium]|nr:H-NS histone family protein [Cardiobacteriaceae bacterium]
MEIQQLFDEISKLNNEDFVALINKLEQIRSQRANEIQRETARQVALLTGGNIIKNKRQRQPLPAKFMHPQTGETWSGQGRQPKWFSDFIEAGGSEKDLLVK